MRRSEREAKGREAIEEILMKCRTCHVAMADGDMPYVVPLSYGYIFKDCGTLELYFHSAPEGKKLDILRKNSKVCFVISDEGEPEKAETPCDSGYYFSSVIGNGKVVFLQDPEEKREGLSIIVKHHTGKYVEFTDNQVESICLYKIVSDDFTGKQKLKNA